jgi:hypothetical protein
MDLARRHFFIKLAAVATATLGWTARKVNPVRWVEAVRGRVYPGPTKPFNPSDLHRPGPWAG